MYDPSLTLVAFIFSPPPNALRVLYFSGLSGHNYMTTYILFRFGFGPYLLLCINNMKHTLVKAGALFRRHSLLSLPPQIISINRSLSISHHVTKNVNLTFPPS